MEKVWIAGNGEKELIAELPLRELLEKLYPEKMAAAGRLPTPQELGWVGPFKTLEEAVGATEEGNPFAGAFRRQTKTKRKKSDAS